MQMDVCTAFLNGTIEEEVYIPQPPSFVDNGSDGRVCKLKKPSMALSKLLELSMQGLMPIS